MFSDENNQLETHVCKNKIRLINKLKNTNLLVDLPILRYFNSVFGPTTNIYIYIYKIYIMEMQVV